MITTQKDLRAAFWEQNPDFETQARKRGTLSKGQNAQVADCRMAWVDFVEHMHRSGEISDALANRATL